MAKRRWHLGWSDRRKHCESVRARYSTKDEPYHGYFFKILKGQGPDQPLGEMDCVIKGVMLGVSPWSPRPPRTCNRSKDFHCQQ